MARLYADEQFPLAVVEFLREMGHDVIRVQDGGIIICRDDRNWEKMAHRINKVISSLASLQGELIRVNRSDNI